jgi:putative ABC transport system permease protein
VVAYTLPARSPDGALLIGLADARNVFGVQAARLWGLAPQANVELSGFRSSAREAVETIGGELVTADQLADELGRGLDRLIGLFDILALLAVLIGGLGIVNTMAVSVVERGREIAILRSHGMTVSQVQAMVVAEASIIGAVGGLAAAALGLLVAWATVTVGAPRDFAAGLAIPWLLLPAAVLLGVAVASAAGIYPARVAARTPITANLKHFE